MKRFSFQKKHDADLPKSAEAPAATQSAKWIVIAIIIILFAFFLVKTFYRHFHKIVAASTTPAIAYHIETTPVAASVSTTENTSVSPAPKALTPQQQMLMQQLILQKEKELQQRLQAPLLMVDNSNHASTTGNTNAFGSATQNTNTAFLASLPTQNANATQATQLTHLNTLLLQGTIIHAILETRADTDLPGMLKAIVSYPVYSADGTNLLIPASSTLLGVYNSMVQQGQNRIFVIWTRIITPSGINLNLSSPGVDELGTAGMQANSISYHFFQNFGTALLFSVLDAGASNAGVSSSSQYNAAQNYRMALGQSLAQSASQSLPQEGLIAPTLIAYQGTPVAVFLSRDVSFENVVQQNHATLMNVF